MQLKSSTVYFTRSVFIVVTYYADKDSYLIQGLVIEYRAATDDLFSFKNKTNRQWKKKKKKNIEKTLKYKHKRGKIDK